MRPPDDWEGGMIKKADLKEGSKIIVPEFNDCPKQRAVVDVIDHEFIYVTVVKEDREGGLLDDGIREIYLDDLPETFEEF